MLDDLNNMVTGVAFSGDGRLLAASSAGRTPILVWDVASILPIDFKAYATPEKPWLELDDSTYGIRWEASTDRLDRTAAFDYVNLAPASHIGILQRSDFDPSDPAKNAALQDEALFGQFLYARNWNSALVIYGQLRKKGNPAAERAWVTLVEQLQAAAKLKPEGSAAQTLNLLKVKE